MKAQKANGKVFYSTKNNTHSQVPSEASLSYSELAQEVKVKSVAYYWVLKALYVNAGNSNSLQYH